MKASSGELFYGLVTALCVTCSLPFISERPRVAIESEVANLKGGANCYYPNPVTCPNALPEENCIDYCWFFDPFHDEDDPLWGFFGTWLCPGDLNLIYINELSTTTKTCDTTAIGWHSDDEKDEAEDCNWGLECDCEPEHPPAWALSDGVSWCWPFGPVIPSPQNTYREVVGEQNCDPSD